MTLPTVIHKANGSHPSKYAGRLDSVPMRSGLDEIKGLRKAEKEFVQTLNEVLPPGLLTPIDNPLVKAYLMWKRIADKTAKAFEKDPTDAQKRLAAVAAHDRVMAMARELGLTPRSRAHCRAPEPQEDAFEIIMERLTE